MTLQTRRRTYWSIFILSLAMLLVAIVFAVALLGRKDMPIFLIEHGIYKMYSFAGLRIPSLTLSVVDVLFSCLFAVVMSASILHTFQKTVSPEIYFFIFWLGSLSFEAIRLVNALSAVSGGSDSLFSFLDRIYVSARLFGVLAIFISGLYAAGLRNEKHFSMIAIAALVSVALTMMMPINTGVWDMTLMFRIGYGSLFRGVVVLVFIVTAFCYIVAKTTRGDVAYYFAAAGACAIMGGAYCLGSDISPLYSIISILTMTAGGGVYIHRLHSYYLWQ
ncbi:MAG: hypothetical protein LLF89_06335 [Spirochaetaceae bacterium]|nr:hypothetical protein [Spirochaetaceae bacterium]